MSEATPRTNYLNVAYGLKSWLLTVDHKRIGILYLLGITAFFSTLIAVLIFYFAIRYRRQRADEIGKPEKAGIWLEVVWSVIPLAILMGMFAWGAKIFFEARRPPADAVEYYVTGKQWMWKIQHPTGHREINTLHVPVGRPVKLLMTSEDVIHSFFIPAFRIKRDTVPGMYTRVHFTADTPGEYHLFCAEYCGTKHSEMIGKVVVMEPGAYETWLSGLAAELHLTVSTMTRVVDQLVARSLARRTRDPDDRRVCRVALTARGRALWRRIEDELLEIDAEVLRALAPSEREALIRALRLLSRATVAWRERSRAEA